VKPGLLRACLPSALASALALTLVGACLPALASSLQLDKEGLALRANDGRLLDRVTLRAKRWDQRPGPTGHVAVVLDADRGLPVMVRSAADKLQVHPLPTPRFEVETLCLHRDPQGLLHLFLLGDEGLSEQWLLGDTTARPLRDLATAPSPEDCQVDDAKGLLHVTEAGLGRWSHRTAAEGKPERWLNPTQPARRPTAPQGPVWPVVLPSAQTDTVARLGDAADDPAIWIHPKDPTRSLVLGTNKKQGLLVYGLDGRQRQLLEVGRLNNVDLRQGVRLGDERRDLAVATHRDERALVLFNIDAEGQVSELARLPTDLDEIYGLCVGRGPDDQLDVFPNDKDGRVQHYRVAHVGGRWQAQLLRQFKLASQPEGCVVDEREHRLFIGEEKRGIWSVDVRGDRPARPQLVMPVGRHLVADVEGLAVYDGATPGQRYLVVSSQGNDSYLVLDAQPPHRLRGGFRIGLNAALGIDGVSETDGLDVTAVGLGPTYPGGMLVVQDGYKRLPQGPQNFKLVAWKDIAATLKLP
jgi:3-phytase